MNIKCPNCGAEVPVGGLGRKRLPIGVDNVCDALRTHSTIKSAAQSLRCSRAYIYKAMGDAGLTLDQIRRYGAGPRVSVSTREQPAEEVSRPGSPPH